MPYDEIQVSVGMMVEGAKWTGPALRVSYGGGFGDSAIVDDAAGLHMWTLKQAQLPADPLLVPIDSKSRLDYYWDFFKAHTTGTTDVFIIEYRGKKYHGSFMDPDMDEQRVAFKLGSPDWHTGGGLKIRQRKVQGSVYDTDGSILPLPEAPGFEVTFTTSTTATFDLT